LVSSINQTMLNLWWRMQTTGRRRQLHLQIDWNRWRAHHPSADFTHWSWLPKPQAPVATHVEGMLVVRDNIWHRSDIEKTYLRAIGRARHSIWLAHAYFIPSRRMRRALQLAITRGVTVHILVQGHYEGFMHHHAMRPVLSSLLQMGAHVYDYAASPLHAKAAVIDGRWATVGSSNIDPLSLLLAREANVVVSDAHFATQLQQQIEHAIAHDSILMSPQTLAQRGRIKRLLDWCAYGIVRMSLWTFGVRY
jgi:cardiolipin synthase A/B